MAEPKDKTPADKPADNPADGAVEEQPTYPEWLLSRVEKHLEQAKFLLNELKEDLNQK